MDLDNEKKTHFYLVNRKLLYINDGRTMISLLIVFMVLAVQMYITVHC